MSIAVQTENEWIEIELGRWRIMPLLINAPQYTCNWVF